MNRPSFQFYPGDWLSNLNLRRCSFHLKGVWLEVMCLMHDSEEYGILRWQLQEITNAVGCQLSDLQELLRYGVLKGEEKDTLSVTFSVSISKKNRVPETVILINDHGPLYFSSRMVRDEYIRKQRAQHGVKSLENPNVPPKKEVDDDDKKKLEKDTDKDIEKDTFSPSPSSSSSPSGINTKENTMASLLADDKNFDENLGSEPTPTQKVKTATAKTVDPGNGIEAKRRQAEVKTFINFAFKTYKTEFNKPLDVIKGKDGAIVKDLIGTFGLDCLKKLWLKFLVADDWLINQAGRSIGIFKKQINKLVSAGQPRQRRKQNSQKPQSFEDRITSADVGRYRIYRQMEVKKVFNSLDEDDKAKRLGTAREKFIEQNSKYASRMSKEGIENSSLGLVLDEIEANTNFPTLEEWVKNDQHAAVTN
jgi:hypothetical protein